MSTYRRLITELHTSRRDEVEEVSVTKEKVGDVVEDVIPILKQYRPQRHSRFHETSKHFNDRWQYIAPNQYQRELLEGNSPNHQLEHKHLQALENHKQ